MRRSSFIPFLAVFGVSAAACAVAILSATGTGSTPVALLPAACDTADGNTAFVPVTGIIIRSDSLVTGIGCGTDPGEVFKYVAFVAPAPAIEGGPAPAQFATVVDCFSDGVFVNLSTAASQEFDVTILAFNQETWNVVGAGLEAAAADAGTVPLETVLTTSAPEANWVTTCTAIEEQQIQVLAVCAPLTAQSTPSEAGIVDTGADVAEASLPDAGHDAAVPVDAGVDAPPDVAADSPQDAPVDAPDAE
jgi:hypothetical protein